MNTPQHVAIILDGNRRWATARGMVKYLGHDEGAKTLENVTKLCINHSIKYLTVYALSTENLKNRSKEEVDHLFELIAKITDKQEEYTKHNIKFRAIGNRADLPQNVQHAINKVEEATKDHTALTLSVALNYGGRDEIIRAIKSIKDPAHINEEQFAQHLDTHDLPDVDLVIRTGGHQRLSNFLPWQTTYAELYFTDIKWPDFDEQELKKALDWFAEQQRNGGK